MSQTDQTAVTALPEQPAAPFIGARDLVLIAIFAGVTAALGLIPPIMVPISPVPITAQSLGPLLAGVVLGAKRGFLSQLLLIVLVMIGLPLLAGGRGGIGVMAGVTVGFIVGWLLTSWFTGFMIYHLGTPYRLWQAVIVTVVASVLLYCVGIPGMMAIGHLSLRQAVIGNIPFLPGDAVKAVLAALVGYGVHRSYPKLLPAGWNSHRAVPSVADTTPAATPAGA